MKRRWQFSIRSLFLITTLSAAICFLFTFEPFLGILSVYVMLLVLAGKIWTFLVSKRPRIAAAVLIALGCFWLFGCGLWLNLIHGLRGSIDWWSWISVISMAVGAIVHYMAAWYILRPVKQQSATHKPTAHQPSQS